MNQQFLFRIIFVKNNYIMQQKRLCQKKKRKRKKVRKKSPIGNLLYKKLNANLTENWSI